ncbi:glycosyltransferase [Paenibacillus ottowii]|uniref:Glycosyltransferase family 4 protein n=1 Tax=Paenibacillus ottowii TaxID=2315729 RepID=A0ABY3AXW2_9BACL|nr:glycosyltransferase [Paenibacillus ottowii]TQR93625.1 glycosyltransferase family 4 protein [Paenibacillus ottowii]
MDLFDSQIQSHTNRRLAVIDTKFPWKLSGFRYWENLNIFQQKPDTLFFATELHDDYFPCKVYPFSDFMKVAVSEGVTDVYCVFLNLTLSLLGHCFLPDGSYLPGANPNLNIKPFLDERNIHLHATLYPGGGLDPWTKKEFLSIAGQHCSTVFTNINEVMEAIVGSIYYPVVINTDLYIFKHKKVEKPIQLTFCAFNAIRKGFPFMADAFNRLTDDFHLNLIGDWEDQLHLLKNKNYTFYGLLSPEELKPVYERTHIFLNCSVPDRFALDGFPTTAAVDALSTGCILVTTNPRNDRFILEEGKDYFEVEPNGYAISERLFWIQNHFEEALIVGKNGSDKVKSKFRASQIVKSKLANIFK